MKKLTARTVAFILIVCLCIPMIPVVPVTAVSGDERSVDPLAALIAGAVGTSDLYPALEEGSVPEIIGYENAVAKNHIQRLYEEEGNDLNKLVFLNIDGSKTMYAFDFPVKYLDKNGKPQDISLEIADSSTEQVNFQSSAHSAMTTFSTRMSDGISLSGNNTEITLVPILNANTENRDTVTRTASTMATAAASPEATRVNTKTIAYRYDDKTSIEYSLTYTGFKEDIVVSEYTGQTEYQFTLYTNGYKLTKIKGSYYLTDAGGNIKATIGDIIIFTADNGNNTFGEIVPTTIVANQEYLLTIVVDEEFLSDEDTVYPIRIDPTVEINYSNNGAGAIEDVTVYTNDTSAASSGSLFAGLKQTAGISRILMKFPGLDLDDLGSNVVITNATVSLRDLMCETTPLDVYCNVYAGPDWTDSSVTWANTFGASANSVSTFLSMNTMSRTNGASLTTPHWYSFDITKAVQGWIDGNYSQNKGIVFKASDAAENGTAYNYKTFGSFNRSTYNPIAAVTYFEETPVLSVSVSPTSASLNVGTTVVLTATVYPLNATYREVSWSSSNTDIATVSSSGVVTGINPGTVTIICTTLRGGQTASCAITVNPATYTAIMLDNPCNGTLSAGRHFWFRFTPSESGWYVFTSSQSVEIYSVLYQGSTQLSAEVSANPEGIKLSYHLSAGTEYRLLVRSRYSYATGNFTIRVTKGWPIAYRPYIYSRDEWGAEDPITARLVQRTRQPQRIVFHHSAKSFQSTNIDDVKEEIKRIQELHMDTNGKCDIAYHFIIDPAGRIWQGAEIDDYQRGHAQNYFDDIGVVILGDFESRPINLWFPDVLNDNQKNAITILSKWLCYKYNLAIIPSGQNTAPISTHRIVDPETVCPGEESAIWIENTFRQTILDWRTQP